MFFPAQDGFASAGQGFSRFQTTWTCTCARRVHRESVLDPWPVALAGLQNSKLFLLLECVSVPKTDGR